MSCNHKIIMQMVLKMGKNIHMKMVLKLKNLIVKIKKKGKEYKFYFNGNKLVEYNYKDGELKGKQYFWYSNNNKRHELNYKNEKLDGKQYYWDSNGNFQKEFNYVNRELEGK